MCVDHVHAASLRGWLWQRRDHLSDFVVNDGSQPTAHLPHCPAPWGPFFGGGGFRPGVRAHPLVSKSFEELFVPQNPQATTPSDDGCLLEVRKSPGAAQDISLNGSSLVESMPPCKDLIKGDSWYQVRMKAYYHVTSCHMCGLPIDFGNANSWDHHWRKNPMISIGKLCQPEPVQCLRALRAGALEPHHCSHRRGVGGRG